MSQKFINLVEKTQKKAPVYEAPKSKRFARKRSSDSDRSIDSKRSRNSAYQPELKINQLQNVQSKHAKVFINTSDFSQNFANSVLLSKQIMPNKQRYGRVRTDRFNQQQRDSNYSKQFKNQNNHYQSQVLTAQLQVRNKQLEVMANEVKLMKQVQKDEKQKLSKVQQQKKQLYCQLSQKSKQLQKLQIQNKKLVKQKQYLTKQIQFLQKISYDDKTRNAQSYREKYLSKQIQQLRKTLKLSKTDMQRHLQVQIKRISDEKYGVETLYKALKVANETLIKQFQKFKAQDKNAIYHCEEYIKLREKYKMCLDAYKRLKIQYVELQKELNRSLSNIPQHLLNSNSQLSIVLSSSSSERSDQSLDKQNSIQQAQRFQKNNKNFLFIEIPKDHEKQIKKSLSPRNRQQKPQITFKKPISPKNLSENGIKNQSNAINTKKPFQSSYQRNKSISQTVSSIQFKKSAEIVNSKQIQQNKTISRKFQKTSNYFNDAYRMKIGLTKQNNSINLEFQQKK